MGLKDIAAKVLSGSAGDIIDKVAGAADRFINTGQEKDAHKLEVQKLINERDIKILEDMQSEDKNVTDRWSADMQSDSWMSKNTRPLTMLSLLAFLYVIIITDSVDIFSFDVKADYIDLLQMLLTTVVVAYFGSRGIEKVTKMRNK